jgi:uncharacterized protein (UPF0261 family)
MEKKTIVLLGCFDTKGEPYSWRRDRIATKGIGTLLVDIGVAGEPTIEPDISASEIARAAGADLGLRHQHPWRVAVDEARNPGHTSVRWWGHRQ